MAELVPTCVWRVTPALVIALDDRFGEPVDAYVNGSQTWLRDDGPGDIAVEWRLHPVSGFEQPGGTSVHELFESVALALATDQEPVASLGQLWDGLEAFPAHGDEVEPAPLASAVAEAIGIAPDASGLVDHAAVGDAWEQSGRRISIVDALFAQLAG